MNSGSRYRDATSPCKIVSAYFSHNLVMDEGSKEATKETQGTSKKPIKTDKIRKRPNKRSKGQKDIRTLVKSKKNELLTYSKDFDLICKQSGIDVDPEQLQLAIALSKSLKDSKSKDNDVIDTEKSLNCNQRRSKIRTTLQEYGFQTVKSIPVKKVKRYKKQYKLILVTDKEKQQKIADKYAEIIIKNVFITKANINVGINNCVDSYLYNLTTNVSYDYIKNDEIFYISDLVPKSLHDKPKLKDWSKIPGRPLSPELELPNHNFKDIDWSQEDLDIILSDSIDTSQDIVKRKHTSSTLQNNRSENCLFTETGSNEETSSKIKSKGPLVEDSCENKSIVDRLLSQELDIKNYSSVKVMSPPINRSCSPDLFGDEVTIIMDKSENKIMVQEELPERTIAVNNPNDFMELTDCVSNTNGHNTDSKHIVCFSQGSKTRSNSNDFMDLTECIPACPQKESHHLWSARNYEKASASCSVIKETKLRKANSLNQFQNAANNTTRRSDSNEATSDDTIIIGDEYRNIESCSKSNAHAIPEDIDVVIDLVENPDESSRISNTTQQFDKSHISKKNHGPLNSNSFKNGKSVKDDEFLDTVDLTQSFYYENCQATTNVHSVQSIASIGIHTKIGSKNVCTENSDYHKTDNTNESRKNTNERSQICNNLEEMDLTQSSDSEDCFPEVVHKASLDNKSLDDTIIVNNEYDNSINVEYNKIGKNKEITQDKTYSNCLLVDVETAQTNTEHNNTENNILPVYDIDNDIAFDNLLDNVSNSKQNNSGLCSDKSSDDLSLNLLNKSAVENDTDNQKIDLTQNDYHSDKIYNNLPNKLGKLNDDDECIIIDNEKEVNKDTKKWNDKNQNSDTAVITFSNCSMNQSKSLMDYDDNEFGNVHRDVTSKSIQCENKDETEIILNENGVDIRNSNIDLTQLSNSSEDPSTDPQMLIVSGELGKRDNISIDYDLVCSEENVTKGDENDIIFAKDEDVSGSSQHSEVFKLSDTEFNYSINQHMQDRDSTIKQTKFDIGGLSIIDDILNRNSLSRKSKLRCSCSSNANVDENKNESCLPVVNNTENISCCEESKSCEEVKFVKISTPLKCRSEDNIFIAKTPRHDNYIIKTNDVTPMPNYQNMCSPERNEELDKFGIKPLKRKRAIQILTHIYNQTHPLMEMVSNDECASPSKISRSNNATSFPRRVIAPHTNSNTMSKESVQYSNDEVEILETNSSQKSTKSRKGRKSPKSISSQDNILYEETTLVPDIRNIECPSEDWIFQKREKAKVYSCRVPLHIAFHNYVSTHKGLREAILKYEPINIDDIHKGLVSIGYRYNPKDLLKFMDKKCITVKTADNSKRTKTRE